MNRFLLILILPLGVFVACKGQSDRPTQQKKSSVSPGQIGSTLPSFTSVDLNGRKLASADLKNKVALIDFWATWCAPCRQEMPGYQKLLDQYGSQGLVVIGFKADMMADTEDPVRFARELGIRYPIAVGSEEIRNKFGGIQGLPTTYIYDRQGILQVKVVGFEYTGTIEQRIKPLL
jgi:thiol-disulfide isomerase/thioredoxin